ncbi:MAG: pilus assembly protein PilM [Lachnospiraceae bacterium]|nr:pilus assembly protein PilM [Lachnospiraceae bacterium]MDD6450563.1 pilus assembly protein PilM [Lachnospiraceae bacterium]
MAKSFLGFEIGSSRLKISEVVNGESVRFQAIDLPDNMIQDGSIVAWEGMVDVIRESVRRYGFHSRKAALVIPDAVSYLRRVTMPRMTEEQLLLNLPYEFHDMINGDKSDYIFDYSMIETRQDETGNGEMDLFGAAISRELMSRYSDLFRRAGLKLVKAAPRDMAIMALMNQLDPDFLSHDTALLSIGYSDTTLDIYRNGIFDTKNTIDSGVNALIRALSEQNSMDPHLAQEYIRTNTNQVQEDPALTAVYDDIAVNVSRSLNYYSFQNRDNSLEEIYYFGGGGHIEPFMRAIAANVNLKMLPLSSFQRFSAEALMDGPATLGICLE